MSRPRRIVALGGGGFSMEPRNPRLDRFLLGLTKRAKPRVLFVPTASGDAADYIARFYKAYAKHPCTPSHLPLFNRDGRDLRSTILKQDMIFVGGGNTANMLAVWRLHGVDALLREAWEGGTLLCGISAGAICWFEGGITDSFGPPLRPLRDGLGILPGSFCPHYDGEPGRRPAYHRATKSGALPSGYAADDSVGVLFEGTTFAGAFASRPHVRAYRVENGSEREIQPTELSRVRP